jgi:predicted metal-dependent phosphoesterase TrpH
MGFLVDLHVHTHRHSSCSRIDEHRLIRHALIKGINGIVLTEHHYQWSRAELDALLAEANAPDFVLLAGFEYTSSKGDILIYGLEPEDVRYFKPDGDPEVVIQLVHQMGGFCVAAHPTRAGLSFDERIKRMPLDGMEIASRNLQPHEQRRASKLAQSLGIQPVTASDAHRINDVGLYLQDFDDAIFSMKDLHNAFRHGRLRPAGTIPLKEATWSPTQT